MTDERPAADRGRTPSPILAALLSFPIPGLGQIYAGRVVRGLVIAIPQVVVIAYLAWIYFERGVGYLGGWLYVEAFGVVVANVVMLVYRALAVVDAYAVARARRAPATAGGRGWSALGAVVLAALLVATVGLHGVAAFDSFVAWEVRPNTFGNCDDPEAELRPRNCDTAEATPTPGPTPGPSATPIPGPTEPGATPGPTMPASPQPGSPVPSATPTQAPIIETDAYWAENGRLDLLLLGSDAGPGRVGTRPDAIHVASVDLATGRSAIVSLPRYLQYPPLPPELAHLWSSCGCFKGYGTGYLNAVYTWATDHPADFPGGRNRGFRATQQVVETLLGIQIDGIVVVDLNGFVNVVDAFGGIVINVPEGVTDDRYNNEQGIRETVNIRAGWQHLNGHEALMYVRSRHQDSDIARLGRQQNFLRAVRRQVTACSVQILGRLPDLLRAVGDSVRTDVPLEDVPTLLELLTRTKKPRRVELHSDNGFRRDVTEPGQRELYLAAMDAAFTARPGEDTDAPEESPPDRFGNGC